MRRSPLSSFLNFKINKKVFTFTSWMLTFGPPPLISASWPCQLSDLKTFHIRCSCVCCRAYDVVGLHVLHRSHVECANHPTVWKHSHIWLYASCNTQPYQNCCMSIVGLCSMLLDAHIWPTYISCRSHRECANHDLTGYKRSMPRGGHVLAYASMHDAAISMSDFKM